MNTLLHWFTSPEWALVVNALLHSLWQGAVIAVALALVLQRVARPEFRYRIAVAGLGAVLLSVMITWGVLNMPNPSATPAMPRPEPAVAETPAPTGPVERIVVVAHRTPATPSLQWTAWLALAWLIGASVMLGRASVKIAGAEQLRHSCRPLNDDAITALLAEARQAVKLTRQVRVAVTNQLTSPAVVGVLVPTLILPLSLITTLTPEQIRFVLLHELAHIRRGDYLANLCQLFAEALLFFNPVVWWLSHQIRREREACCDTLAIELSGAPADYARTLVSVAETLLNPSPAAASAFGNDREPSSLTDRVQRVLVPGYRPSLRLTWRAMLAALVAGGVVLGLLAAGARQTIAATSSLLAKVQPAAQSGQSASIATATEEVAPLDRRVSLDSRPMPFKEALAKVCDAANVRLEIDEASMKTDGLDANAPVTIALENETLDTALIRIFSSLDLPEYPTVFRRLRGDRLFVGSIPSSRAAEQAATLRALPDWLKPLQGNGLNAETDENGYVTSLYIGAKANDELLAQLAMLPRLRELNIETTREITPVGLAHLGKLPALEDLALYMVNVDGRGLGNEALRAAAQIKTLRSLSVGECSVTDDGLRVIEGMTQLTALNLSGNLLTDTGMKSLAGLTNLQSLGVSGSLYVHSRMQITDEGLKYLSRLTELRELNLSNLRVSGRTLSLPRLKSLDLSGNLVTDESLASIARCEELKHLELVSTSITDAGLQRVASLKELTFLRITSSRISDAGIVHLTALPKLEFIELRCPYLTDESLRHISRIKSLTRVDLYGRVDSGVASGQLLTLQGLLHLKALPKLHTLWLTHFSLPSFLGLRELAQLRHLTIFMSGISEAEEGQLETAMPRTKISTGRSKWSVNPARPSATTNAAKTEAESATWLNPPPPAAATDRTNSSEAILHNRTFKISAPELARLTGNVGPVMATNSLESVRAFFAKASVDVTLPGRTMFFKDTADLLFVRATTTELETIERILTGRTTAAPNSKSATLDSKPITAPPMSLSPGARVTCSKFDVTTVTVLDDGRYLYRRANLDLEGLRARLVEFTNAVPNLPFDVLTHTNAPVQSVSNVVELIAELGAKARIEPLSPPAFTETDLHTRTFKVSAPDLARALGNVGPAATTNTTELAREFFARIGVDLQLPGRTAFFTEFGQVLFVRATVLELHKVEAALMAPITPKQSTNNPPSATPPGVPRDQPVPVKPIGTTNASAPNTNLFTRTFKVDPNSFVTGLENAGSLKATNLQDRIRAFFTSVVADLQPPKAVYFNDRQGGLLVRASLADLDIIEQAIQVLSAQAPQVNIRAKFVEVPGDGSGKLFLGTLGSAFTNSNGGKPADFAINASGSAGTNNLIVAGLTGILTPAQFKLVSRALEQREGVEIMSMPSVTTLSGRQAPMMISPSPTQFVAAINPLALTPPGLASTNDGNDIELLQTNALPFGLTLDLISEMLADGQTMSLSVTATGREFLGYDPQGMTNMTSVYIEGHRKSIPSIIPRFSEWQTSRSAVLGDGHTMVFGADRSTPARTNDAFGATQRQLLIFITPTIVDAAGNRVNVPADGIHNRGY